MGVNESKEQEQGTFHSEVAEVGRSPSGLQRIGRS